MSERYEPLEWETKAVIRKDKAYGLLDTVREVVGKMPDNCMISFRFSLKELVKQKQQKLSTNNDNKTKKEAP